MMLHTRKALKLAELLNPFIPKVDEDDNDILDFVGRIVGDIRSSDHPEVFADAMILMYDYSDDELVKLSGMELAEKFSSGLAENQIISLCEFYQWLTM